MPCGYFDNHDPDPKEYASRKTAKLILYALKCLGKPAESWIIDASTEGNVSRVDELYSILCNICGAMNKIETDSIIYNGRLADSRKLADWWDRHKIEDEERGRLEKQELEKKKLRERAKKKLTQDEIDALLDE